MATTNGIKKLPPVSTDVMPCEAAGCETSTNKLYQDSTGRRVTACREDHALEAFAGSCGAVADIRRDGSLLDQVDQVEVDSAAFAPEPTEVEMELRVSRSPWRRKGSGLAREARASLEARDTAYSRAFLTQRDIAWAVANATRDWEHMSASTEFTAQ